MALNGTSIKFGYTNIQPSIVTALFFTHIAHHKRARLNNFHDEGYAESMFKNAEIYNEKTALISLAGAATVFLPVAPFLQLGFIMAYGIIGVYIQKPI